MQVILLRDMDKLGDRFDIVAVKNGYGRNFLIPQGIAQIANKINLANLEEIKKVEEAEERVRLASEIAEIVTWDLNIPTQELIYSDNLPLIFGFEKLPVSKAVIGIDSTLAASAGDNFVIKLLISVPKYLAGTSNFTL